jgi:hypothetical protein
MDEDKNEVVEEVEVVEEETPEAELTPETDWEAEAKKARGIAQRLRTKLTKAEEKKKVVEPVKKTEPKTGGLDETQLDYLDIKGITDADDVSFIEKFVLKTGETVRNALKDEIVIAKLASNKAKRDVESATPSGTRRGGEQTTDLSSAIAKFESTGELPKDFALASKVTDAIADKSNKNKPSWH